MSLVYITILFSANYVTGNKGPPIGKDLPINLFIQNILHVQKN